MSQPVAEQVSAPKPVQPTQEVYPDVGQPAYRLPQKDGDFAVVVGIEKYSNDLPDAQFAERDAQAVKNHLLALGVPERNIKFLVGPRATLSGLASYTEDWLSRNVKEGGRVFFYFSGHGAPDPESGQAYLVPWDGNPSFLDKTAYPLKKLYAKLGGLKAKQVIVALDACFSGAGGRSVLAKGTRPLVNKVDMDVAPNGKLVLFAATSAKETTSTLDDQGHGIFTYYFLKGLGGEAKDKSGAITMRGLYDYLKPKVQDAASRQNRDQTPMLEGAGQDAELVRFK
ncbi:MAG: caspase family protein [Elusimicrobia bacterium]|nr:caspase family protein [Elusimicrobiota bacterium]